MKRAGKTFSCSRLLIHQLFDKRTVLFVETHARASTLLMAREILMVWEILIPPTCIDFDDWENPTCSRNHLFNLFEKSKNNK